MTTPEDLRDYADQINSWRKNRLLPENGTETIWAALAAVCEATAELLERKKPGNKK